MWGQRISARHGCDGRTRDAWTNPAADRRIRRYDDDMRATAAELPKATDRGALLDRVAALEDRIARLSIARLSIARLSIARLFVPSAYGRQFYALRCNPARLRAQVTQPAG